MLAQGQYTDQPPYKVNRTELQFQKSVEFLGLRHAKLALAVSGGLDSIALLHLCVDAGLNVVVGHFNHQLRGCESDEDEQFVAHLCKHLDIEIYLGQPQVPIGQSKRQSIQDEAHNVRMEWFHRTFILSGLCSHVLTAHHANDKIESYLMQAIFRGVPGPLVGIEMQTDWIARPLLNLGKHDLKRYALAKRLRWREDSSNLKNDYLRNQIRNEVIPQLQQIEQGMLSHVSAQIQFQTELKYLADHALEQQRLQAVLPVKNGVVECFDPGKLLSAPSPILLVRHILLKFGHWHHNVPAQIVEALQKPEGQGFYNGAFRVSVYKNELRIEAGAKNSPELSISFEISEIENCTPLGPIDDSSILVDASLISPEKLNLRPWKPADRFIPLGLGRWKKVSDQLTDLKVRGVEREIALVLEQDGEIVWLVGQRLDDRFKVTPSTRKVMRISLIMG